MAGRSRQGPGGGRVSSGAARSYRPTLDMSERITTSPGWRPSRISMVFTEPWPRRTGTRTASGVRARCGRGMTWVPPVPWPGAHVEHVVEALDLDDPVHAQVRAGSAGEGALQGHIHGHGAGLDGGVDAHDPALHDAVPGVDGGAAARWPRRGPGSRGSGAPPSGDPARPPGPAPAPARPTAPPGGGAPGARPRHPARTCMDAARPSWKARDGPEALHLVPLHGELALHILGGDLEARSSSLEAAAQLLGVPLGPFHVEAGDEVAAASSRFVSTWRRASRYSASTVATTTSWFRRWVSREARRFTASASAAESWRSASSPSSWTSGFESSTRTVPGPTESPGGGGWPPPGRP
jgi:hypothetical protein